MIVRSTENYNRRTSSLSLSCCKEASYLASNRARSLSNAPLSSRSFFLSAADAMASRFNLDLSLVTASNWLESSLRLKSRRFLSRRRAKNNEENKEENSDENKEENKEENSDENKEENSDENNREIV